jgi:hypothetical protein
MRGCQLAHLRLAVLKKKISFEGERVGILKFCISHSDRHELTVSLVYQGHPWHEVARASPATDVDARDAPAGYRARRDLVWSCYFNVHRALSVLSVDHPLFRHNISHEL